MDQKPINTIRQTIGTGFAPNCITLEVQAYPEEMANDAVMGKRMSDAINVGLKFLEEAKLVFSPEARAAQAPQPSSAPNPAPQPGKPGASQTTNPKCSHGDRIWKDFTSKKGNKVKGWFCCSDSKDFKTHCEPLYPESK